MAYVRDDKTGKFSWVEGELSDDERPYVPPTARRGREANLSQLLIALVVVGLVALLGVWGVRAFREPAVSIRRIHNHPAEFNGRKVVLRGRVGEVFNIGGSYAYFLVQDRDTIVVFTRGGRPSMHSTAEVHGSISIGYLDGAPRPALFENN